MATKDRLQSGRGNALLVSGSIYQACKLYALFQEAGLNEVRYRDLVCPDCRQREGGGRPARGRPKN